MTEPCRHDLNPASCATCAGIEDLLNDDPPGRPFTARFDGTCAGCGFDIRVGERIRYREGRTVHDWEATGCSY